MSGTAIVCTLFLMSAYRDLLFNKEVWILIWLRIASLTMLLSVTKYLDIAFYAWSVHFIDVSIAAILFETRTILLVLLIGLIFRAETRYRKIDALTLFLFVIAFAGVASVIISQAGGLNNLSAASLPDLAFGVTLVLIAAAISSMSAYGLKWGTDFANRLSDNHGYGNDGLEMFGVIIGTAISSAFTIPVTMLVGFASNEPMTLQPVVFGLSGGIAVGSLTTVIWRKANLITHDLSINAVAYITPVFALIWLFAFSLAGDVSVEYLIFGAFLIIIANIGVYLQLDAPQQQTQQAREDVDAKALIAAGESDTVEFKSTLRTNLHTNKRDAAVERAAIRTLAAFLNTDGGALIIGVSDDGAPVGVETDGFRSEDSMSLHLRNIVNRDIGAAAMSRIRLSYDDFGGVRVLAARCDRLEQPVYVKDGRYDRFYIRTGPSTTELSISEAINYIETRRL